MAFDPDKHPRGGDPTSRGRLARNELDATSLRPNSAQQAHVPLGDLDPELVNVLESAARLQELVPEAVLVGGSAASLYAGHRRSYDHDHVVGDLRERFDIVLEALEREPDWVLNRATPGKILLGELGDIEAGVRQLIRTVPLEVRTVTLPSGRTLTVPTREETLRIKAFLIVRRNQVRDYLDVAALADRYGPGTSAQTLSRIDRYYTDPAQTNTPVADQLIRQLASPRPKDSRTMTQLASYKALDARWHDWSNVSAVTSEVARRILEHDWDD